MLVGWLVGDDFPNRDAWSKAVSNPHLRQRALPSGRDQADHRRESGKTNSQGRGRGGRGGAPDATSEYTTAYSSKWRGPQSYSCSAPLESGKWTPNLETRVVLHWEFRIPDRLLAARDA